MHAKSIRTMGRRGVIVACFGLTLSPAAFAVSPLEATLGASVNAFLYPTMPAASVVTQSAIAAGASSLTIDPTVTAAVLASHVSADLQFSSANAGSLTVQLLASVTGESNDSFAEGYKASAVAGSLYNAQAANPALASYAFVVGGNGDVALTWNIWTTNSRTSEFGNNLSFGHLTTSPASLDVYHLGLLTSQILVAPTPLRSASSTDISFSALAGDTVVLRLLPNMNMSTSGSFTGIGTLSQDVAITFQVTAVPEPETYAMMLAGLGLMGFVARRRKQGQAPA